MFPLSGTMHLYAGIIGYNSRWKGPFEPVWYGLSFVSFEGRTVGGCARAGHLQTSFACMWFPGQRATFGFKARFYLLTVEPSLPASTPGNIFQVNALFLLGGKIGLNGKSRKIIHRNARTSNREEILINQLLRWFDLKGSHVCCYLLTHPPPSPLF